MHFRKLREPATGEEPRQRTGVLGLRAAREAYRLAYLLAPGHREGGARLRLDQQRRQADRGRENRAETHPRRKGSAWSELNKERCCRIERLGRMTDAGRKVLPDMSPKGFASSRMCRRRRRKTRKCGAGSKSPATVPESVREHSPDQAEPAGDVPEQAVEPREEHARGDDVRDLERYGRLWPVQE